MRVTNIENPVRLSWIIEEGFRLDCRPYLSGGLDSRKLLERLPGTVPLNEVTGNQIFHPGRVTRRWVTDSGYGVPFFSSTDIMEADYSFLPLISQRAVDENPKLLVRSDWTLVTRSGSVGRIAYARPDIDGFACSEDILRVVPDADIIPPGYLYTFLRSRYGVPMVVGSAYGAIVQHIERSHIADLPVPRIDLELEELIDRKVRVAARLRADFQAKMVAATTDLFLSAGLPQLVHIAWHDKPRELGFEVRGVRARTLRALNFSPRARAIIDALASVPHRTLGEICVKGQLSSGVRFKRMDADPEYGVRLIGQRQAFWARPEGRWISLARSPTGIKAEDETTLVAAQGTLGENEVFGRAAFVTGRWLAHAYSQHFLRIVSGESDMPGAYMFAFLRSPAAFRVFRSFSVGSKQQDIHEKLRAEIPIPLCTPADRKRIAETVRSAYRDLDSADVTEDDALELLETTLQEAAG